MAFIVAGSVSACMQARENRKAYTVTEQLAQRSGLPGYVVLYQVGN